MAVTIDDLKQLYDGEKLLGDSIGWIETETRTSVELTFSAPLQLDGLIYEGLYLKGLCNKFHPEKNVSFSLIYMPAGQGKAFHLGRIEWRPFVGHTNKGRAPSSLKFKELNGSHLHCFHMNSPLGIEAFEPEHNLPIADALDPDPDRFLYLYDCLKSSFNIIDARFISEPPWEGGLI